MEPWELTIEALMRQYRDRSLSPTEAVTSVLTRIDQLQPLLNCFIEVDGEGALDQARHATEELARDVMPPPLLGIALGIKDNIDVAGWRTTGGSVITDDVPSSVSAPVVARVQDQGGIVVGKTNMYELAFGGVSPQFGEVRNPWAVERNCSASSSGSACAVAARLVHGAMGTDTGGSVRLPAAACGVVGIKPTRDLLSRRGVIAVSSSLDAVGPIARTVTDAAILLEAMCSGKGFTFDRQQVDRGARGLTVGIPDKQETETLDATVAGEFERCADVLRREGAGVVVVDVPDHLVSREVMWTISGAEMAERWAIQALSHVDVSDAVKQILSEGMLIRAVDYLRAQRVRGYVTDCYAAAFKDVDVVMMPVAPTPATMLDEDVVEIDGVTEPYMASLTRYCPVANVGGFPAVAVPSGLSNEGLPLSVQFVARHHGEDLVLRAARAIERMGSDVATTVPSAVRCPVPGGA